MKVLGYRLILCFEGAKSMPGMNCCLKVYAHQKDAQKNLSTPFWEQMKIIGIVTPLNSRDHYIVRAILILLSMPWK